MLENVENVVGDSRSPTEGMDSEFITIPRKDYDRLVYERDEYRSIAHAFDEKFESISKHFQDDGGVEQ